MAYQPKTGEKCHCKRGVQRDNCPDCEGTGMRIDFAAIRNDSEIRRVVDKLIEEAAAELVKKYGRH